jgi:predicted GH43/DUF377 family glycosyl hydrolase
MPTGTTNLNLTGYNTTTDSNQPFVTFRSDIAGTTNSNMTKIDDWAGTVNTRVTALENSKGNILVNATWISSGYYEASVAKITAYTTDLGITLRLSQDNDGTTTLNINSLGTKSLLKYDTSGNLVNLLAKDLMKNHEYYFRYNGTSFVLQGATTSEQISYNNTESGLDARDVKDAIDELNDKKIDKTQIKNTLTETVTGNVLDATKGKELKDEIGDLELLNTTNKISLVDSVNEVVENIGDLSALNTTDKTSTVNAINENTNKISILSTYPLKTITDLNLCTSVDSFSFNVTPLNCPTNIACYCTVKVWDNNQAFIYQELQGIGYQEKWYRIKNVYGWQDWVRIDDVTHYLGFYNGKSIADKTYNIGISRSHNGVLFTKESIPFMKPRVNSCDAGGMNAPCPVIVEGLIYLYYAVYNKVTLRWDGIGLAILNMNGGIIKRYRDRILNLGGASDWDSSKIFRPFVIYDKNETDSNKKFRMFYNGADSSGVNRGGIAYSSDGIAWTKSASNPILDVGSAGSWDSLWAFPEYIVKKDDVYYMTYNGYDGSAVKVGYATSNSLEGSWTKSANNPIISNRPSASQNITVNCVVGSNIVNVSNSSSFIVNELCYLSSALGTENVKIKSKLSSTQIELYEKIVFAHTTSDGVIKSMFSKSIGPSMVRFESNKWKLWGSTWGAIADYETTFYAEGNTLETLQIQYDKSPCMNYDTTIIEDWDSSSQENLKFICI